MSTFSQPVQTETDSTHADKIVNLNFLGKDGPSVALKLARIGNIVFFLSFAISHHYQLACQETKPL